MMVASFMSKYTKAPAEDYDIPDIVVVHGDRDDKMPWPKARTLMKSIIERPSVEVALVPDMRHDLYSEKSRWYMYDFLRERSKQ